jgi:hypothetical protein
LRLGVEIVEIGELTSGEEIVADIADGAFDTPFLVPRATATGRSSYR